MKYLSDLKWLKELPELDESQRKVLLALSHHKFSWRTKERIAKDTGMTESQVDEILGNLISQQKVRPSISKKQNVIFGLRERVG